MKFCKAIFRVYYKACHKTTFNNNYCKNTIPQSFMCYTGIPSDYVDFNLLWKGRSVLTVSNGSMK